MVLQNLNSSHERYKITINTPSFFKIIIDTSANHLVIPPVFVKEEMKSCWSEATAATATATATRETRWGKLVNGSGKSWKVKIREVDGAHYFADGWPGFKEDNNVEFGDFLVFWMVHRHRHSIFTFFVSIYAPHGCPKGPVSPLPTNNNACARSGDQGVKHQTLGLGHSKHQNVQTETRTRTMIKIEYEELLPRTIYMQQNGKGSNGQDNLKKQSGKKRGRPPLKDSMPLMRGRGRPPLKKKKTEIKHLPKKSYWREDRDGESKEGGLMKSSDEESTPSKRARGRPPGSKNKLKMKVIHEEAALATKLCLESGEGETKEVLMTQPGKPRGQSSSSDEDLRPAKRARGKPPGSVNNLETIVVHEEEALAEKLPLESGQDKSKEEELMTQQGRPGQRSSAEESTPSKKGSGKPPGSINTLETIVVHEEAALAEKLPLESERDKNKEEDLRTQPGRPRGQRSSDEESTPTKRGSGRPPGSKNKSKMKANPEDVALAKKLKLESAEGGSEEGLVTQPGRPRGQRSSDEESTPTKRGSGRPPGSKIKSKMKASPEDVALANKLKVESAEGGSEVGLVTQPGRPRGQRSSDEESTPTKRRSGRPPGSKIKSKMKANPEDAALAKELELKSAEGGSEEGLVTQPGRPRGQRSSDEESTPAKRGSGRPPGSKIKSKMKENPEDAALAKKLELESAEGESEEDLVTHPGRPRGQTSSDEESTPAERGTVSTTGSKNKMKIEVNHEGAALAKKLGIKRGKRGKKREKATYHLRSNSYLRSHPYLRSHARCNK